MWILQNFHQQKRYLLSASWRASLALTIAARRKTFVSHNDYPRLYIYVNTPHGYHQVQPAGETHHKLKSKCTADGVWAHRRERVGRDGGDGGAGLSDLKTEEPLLLQAQVVEYQVQQNQAFILLLKDGKQQTGIKSQPDFLVARFVHANKMLDWSSAGSWQRQGGVFSQEGVYIQTSNFSHFVSLKTQNFINLLGFYVREQQKVVHKFKVNGKCYMVSNILIKIWNLWCVFVFIWVNTC